MEDLTEKVLVPLFFVYTTLSTVVLAWWFFNKKQQVFKYFGIGMAGYAAGLAAWSAVVLIKPDDLRPLVLLGVIPFLLANIAFAKAASTKFSARSNVFMSLTIVLIVATFIARTFFYESEPYFSEEGLLFFGLQSIPVALYIATISVSFLPATRAVAAAIKDKTLKAVMGIGLTTLYVNAIILVSANDDTLLLINGVVLSAALLALWTKSLSTKKV